MNSSNRVLGLLSIGGGIGIWLLCGAIPATADAHILPPSFFPRLLAVVLGGLGLLLFIEGKGQPFSDAWNKVATPRSLFFVAAILIYTYAFRYVDYRLLTPVYIFAVMWVMGARIWRELILTPLIATAVLYLSFTYGFRVLLPTMG